MAAAAQNHDGAPLPVPFGVGERLEYDVKFGKLRVGSGSMEVAGVQEVRGRSTWHTIFQVRGGTFFYRVNDQYESWIDRHTGNSLRFRQDLNEGRRDIERAFEIYPERSVFQVQPVIKTRGIFSENGHAEVWLSDDENRIMLQMKSGLSFGSLNLYLKSYRPAQAGATVRQP